ncbi:hypothetical protein AB0904_04600 [Streptomyces sp. NPDC006684]|uniref:hypothetical protein n=1 Tax=unclassified Streptomyces TaxID=2593676 RepID=UPI0034526301
MSDGPRTLLEQEIRRRGWRGFRDVATAYDSTARSLFPKNGPTLTEATYYRWLGPGTRSLPRPDACVVLERLLGHPAERLFGPPLDDDPHDTYHLKELIQMTAEEAATDARSQAASISELTIDHLRDEVAEAARAYPVRPPAQTVTTGRSLREQAERLREQTRVPDQHRELTVLAGQASALLSVAVFDCGELPAARSLARTAGLYAEVARDVPLQAYALGTLAYIAYHQGQPAEALRQVRRADALGSGVGAQGRRRLQAIAARALGHHGDREQALSLLAATDEVLAEGATDDLHDIGGEFGFSAARCLMSAGTTALLIGDAESAKKASRRALGLARVDDRGVAAKAAVDLGLVLLLAGELDEAAEVLAPLWQLAAEQRGTGLVQRAGRLRAALADPQYRDSPLALELAERAEDVLRSANARPPLAP